MIDFVDFGHERANGIARVNVLCCAVECCDVLCCAVLYCVVLYCAML